MPVDTSSVKSLFLAALEKSPAERAAFLDQACSDPDVRARVDELLAGHDAGSFPDFLAEGAAAHDATQSVVSTPNDATQTSAGPTDGDGPSLTFLSPPREAGHLGRLDHYEILSVIGQGGMGVVLKAHDESLDRIVAIKVLGSQYAANGTARKRFIREAKAVAAVVHENVVNVHAVDERVPYLVMQYVKGISLQDRLDRTGPLELKEILRIGMQIAGGLAAAHAQGIVHRDIKPSNILLENGIERVKLTDFGLARAVDDASVTQSGVIAGTPMYMSPEQARGEVVDPRSDLFSLGSVLYALCTGHAPFRASGTMAVMKRVIEANPRAVREQNADMPDWLEAIVLKLLAKKPDDRFQTAKEVAELLEQQLAHLQQPGRVAMPAPVSPPRPKPRPQPPRKSHGWVVVLVVCLVLGVMCVPVLLIGGFYLFWAVGPVKDQGYQPTAVSKSDAVGLGHQRGDENLVVGLDDRDLRVVVEDENGEEHFGTTDGLEQGFRLPAGRYHVRAIHLARRDVLVFQQWVTLKEGERQTVGAESGWVQLFNGRDLRGWEKQRQQPGNWRVEGGDLVGHAGPNPNSHLISTRGGFTDFHLRVEVQMVRIGNGGVYFRCPSAEQTPSGFPKGYEAQIFFGEFVSGSKRNEPFKTGSLHGSKIGEEPPAKADEWFVMEVIARGDRITIKVNGKTTVDDVKDDTYSSGHIGLQVMGPESVVKFRRIEIKDLTTIRDVDRLQGAWRAVSGSFAGQPLTPEELKLARVVFTGDHIRATLPPKGLVGEGSFTLNPTANPKQITVKAATENNQALEGIYRFDGGRLVLCIGGGKDSRPTAFITKAGKSYGLLTLEREPPKDKPFTLTPPKVLEQMVGAWAVEFTTNAGPDKGKNVAGWTLIDPIAGGRFVRLYTRLTPDGPSDLQVLGFDRDQWEFRGMFFDPKGAVFGPSAGKFDAATRTLTTASQPTDGVIRVKNYRFAEPDTITWEVIWRDRTAQVLVDRKARLQRLPPPTNLSAEPEQKDLSREMTRLDWLVGTWQTEMGSLARPGEKWKVELVGKKVLGGRFVEVRERVLPSGEEHYTLYTYDPQKKVYPSRYFSSRWPQAEGTGTWDEGARSMTWLCEGGTGAGGVRTAMTWKHGSADRVEFRVTVKDPDGKLLEDLEGTHTRRKK